MKLATTPSSKLGSFTGEASEVGLGQVSPYVEVRATVAMVLSHLVIAVVGAEWIKRHYDDRSAEREHQKELNKNA